MAVQRADRIGMEIHRALADILRNDMNDPRISTMCSVLRIEISRDLSYCKAYISMYGDKQEQKSAFDAIEKATPFIRRQLGSKLRLRKMPEIKMIFDNSIEYSVRIGQLINQLNSEQEEGEV